MDTGKRPDLSSLTTAKDLIKEVMLVGALDFFFLQIANGSCVNHSIIARVPMSSPTCSTVPSEPCGQLHPIPSSKSAPPLIKTIGVRPTLLPPLEQNWMDHQLLLASRTGDCALCGVSGLITTWQRLTRSSGTGSTLRSKRF